MPDDVETPEVDADGNPIVKPAEKPGDKPPAHPDTVPWTQYVGLKETARKAEESLKNEVETLKGQLKTAVTPEQHEKLQGELTEAQKKLTEASDELKTVKDKSLSEKRDILTKKGMSKEEVEKMSEEAVNGAVVAIQSVKPAPDLGTGGGSGSELKGSPLALATKGYEEGGKSNK